MAENSKIHWTDHTWNPWWGCVKVSPACANCYAETLAKRMGFALWGEGADRKEWTEKNWRLPFKWNEAARRAGRKATVFCASMADIFEDHPKANALRGRAMETMEACDWLTWLLLTKRPENITSMVPQAWRHAGWPNIWYGVTGETRGWASERVSRLLLVPAAGRFLSIEPLLDNQMEVFRMLTPSFHSDALGTTFYPLRGLAAVPDCDWSIAKLDWVIIGGESGGNARPFSIPAAWRLICQCDAAGVAVFLKQLGARPRLGPDETLEHWPAHVKVKTQKGGGDLNNELILRDGAGGDWDEWRPTLRIRQFPANLRTAPARPPSLFED